MRDRPAVELCSPIDTAVDDACIPNSNRHKPSYTSCALLASKAARVDDFFAVAGDEGVVDGGVDVFGDEAHRAVAEQVHDALRVLARRAIVAVDALVAES